MNRNLFNEEKLSYLTEADINRYIRVYGNLAADSPVDFIHDPARTLELIWEIVTAKAGSVRFGYTLGSAGCLVWAGKHDEYRARADTIGRAVANLFIEIIRSEAAL